MFTQVIQPQAEIEAHASRPQGDVASPSPGQRPSVRGKFLFVGDEKLYVRGVSYGPFAPEADGCEYHTAAVVEADFRKMAEAGINTVRVYTVPPRWLLDIAREHGMYVLVGLPWEQHVAFLDEPGLADGIERRVREGVRACAGHPAVLAFVIGNEIATHIVRWYGRRPVEKFLSRLCLAVRDEDAEALVTYANYPSTEYLQLPFLDFTSFNVYLETPAKLEAYLARLQNIAGDRPLVVTELGMDSLHHGEQKQAESLAWQIESVFAGGSAGVVVFAWTDEWFRGGMEVDGWKFGLTDVQRNPKPALEAVRRAMSEVPFASDTQWPLISVIVCTYNGSRTIRECMEGLRRLEYPRFEVIVVDDGSTDGVGDIVREYDVRLITTRNRGLSNARNTGLLASHGEIAVYIDDDAYPDPHWLQYLAHTFKSGDYAAVGGPNIPPDGDGQIAACVAHAPGGPTHVLLTDRIAEHVPGCNMAFLRERLLEIEGFDSRFRIAGDDVDVCWRIQHAWTIGFSPAAMVWHHRRNSIKTYWKQQRNYGRAEAMLERKWPQKYNALGHSTWAGRLYGGAGIIASLGWRRMRIYHGTWGSALFQSVYQNAPSPLWTLSTTPEWYLLVLLLLGIGLSGLFHAPLLMALPIAALAAAVPLGQAIWCASRPGVVADVRSPRERFVRRGILIWMHLMQPAARLLGRLGSGLTPWRRHGGNGWVLPRRRRFNIWSERWQDGEQRLMQLERMLECRKAVVARGGDFDNWDLEMRGGILGRARILMTSEEHGSGRQMVRFQAWPTISGSAVRLGVLLAGISLWLWLAALLLPAMIFTGLLAGLWVLVLMDQSTAMSAVVRVLRTWEGK